MTLTGEVITADEPNLLVFTWGDEVLRFELHPEHGGTRFVLIDELSAGSAARNAAGWDVCLDTLAQLSPNTESWQPLFEAYAAAFEPLIGPQEGPPEGYQGN